MGYDAWKTQDGGERLGRGTGKREGTQAGACTGCGFHGDAAQTVQHAAQSGHTVTYHGKVQG